MTEPRPYPSDLSDARWALVEPVLTAWRAERRAGALDIGRPPEHDLRDILNAILYVNRTGIPWRYLPTSTRPGRPSTPTSPAGSTKASSSSSPACSAATCAPRPDATPTPPPA
ncbi:transposase [Nonomuraea wenchangensis]|uniref:transposase n=1 Tax=Nonomuraea wenchangensis TaxID=568860 RepID=UPI00341E2A14